MGSVARAVVAAGIVALAAGGCAASPSTSTGPSPSAPASVSTAAPTAPSVAPASSAPIASCATSALKGSLGPEQGAAGSVYAPLVLTNVGPRACELRGFPGVSYVAGDDGHQVGPAAVMEGARGAEVVLKPGTAAAAQLRLVNVANFDPAVCRPTPVRGLRVYPPGDAASLYIQHPGTGCAGTPPGNQLSVQTLKPA